MKNKLKRIINIFFLYIELVTRNINKLKKLCGINPFRRIIIFDVGANDGSNFIELTMFPWVTVHAFEPTPELAQFIRNKTLCKSNYILNELAVSNEEGTVNFNIAGLGDWGCSSILDFSDNINETWENRSDLKFTKTIVVSTIKLATYVKENKIKKIDFLHIDIQGFDLVALKSLEEYIGIVKRGVVEVPMNESVKLYKGQHSKEEMLAFLEKNNFRVTKVTSQQNEENLYFEYGNHLS